MTKRTRFVLLVTLILLQAASAGAITRAARKVAFFEVHGGYAMAQGTLEGQPGRPFPTPSDGIAEGKAIDIYEDGFAVGASYGQINAKHWLVSIGFDYSRNKVKDPYIYRSGEVLQIRTPEDDLTYKRYDLTIRALYAPANPVRHSWTPFVGIGVNAGYSSLTAPGYQTNNVLDFGLNLDFGLDVKVWQLTDSRQFIMLSSTNSWNFMSTNERVSHIQVGAGIKYFFGP